MRELPSGTVTFLFTDVEGSTRLLRELGADNYGAALAEHRRVLREAFRAYHGVEVDTQGDAFFVAFERASDALAAASAAQESLGSGRVRVRMGIHTGEPLLGDEGYVGLDVHKTARIAAAGHGGQVLVSEQTARLVSGAALRELGLHRLKDLSAPERIYQLGDGDHPPLKTLHRTNLPIPSTPFLGRANEVAAVKDLLAREGTRVVTLVGPGGTGKTRLALQAAAETADDFPDGVFWVSLAPVRDPQLVLDRAAQSLEAKRRVAEEISDKHMLVIFDNFEHLLEAASGVSELVSLCPNLKVVVTSREPLHLSAETLYAVPPLREDEAVELFTARAGANEVDPTIRTICARLDCLPLAVELAAARMTALSARQILERLERSLPLLTGGPRDAPDRQRTLRATIEWSYDLLSEDEQRLFARLAVFTGGCTLEAAEEVVGADVDTLQSLVEKSLVRHTDERFWMLETIREYAVERLEHSDEAHDLRRRHAERLASVTPPLARRLRASDMDALPDLHREHDNVAAAFDWALEEERFDLCELLIEGSWTYWITQGLTGEGYRRARATIERAPSVSPDTLVITGELARFSGRLQEAIALKEAALERFEEEGGTHRMYVSTMTDLAEALAVNGELDRAEEWAKRALAIREKDGLGFGIAHARLPLALVALQRGENARAAALCEESIPLWREAEAWTDLALQQLLAGTAYRRAGERDRARVCVGQGLALAVEIHDESLAALGVEQIAAFTVDNGDIPFGLRLFGAARSWRQSSGYAFALDEHALIASAGAIPEEERAALLAEGAAWPIDLAAARALDSLGV